MKVSVINKDNEVAAVLNEATLLRLEICIRDVTYSMSEREGELCISVDHQAGIRPLGATVSWCLVANNMLKIHDAQLCAITKSEFSNAIQEVIRQLDSGNFSKPNDLVLAKQYNYDVTNSSKSHIH